MVKHKKKRSRQGLFSKAINIGLIALGFSRVITNFMTKTPESAIFHTIREATFGLIEGKFDLKAGLAMYSPGGAAVALGKLKSHLFRKFPVR